MESATLNRIEALLAGPAGLSANDRDELRAALEQARQDGVLEAAAHGIEAMLQDDRGNVRLQYAAAVARELTGNAAGAANLYLQLGRQFSTQEDWAAVREVCLRGLPLGPDQRFVAMLLAAWQHLPDDLARGQDLQLARDTCPDAPQLLWLASQEADAAQQPEKATQLALAAVRRFVESGLPDEAEEPLLRALEAESEPACRQLIEILPQMARANQADLLTTTIDLLQPGAERFGLGRELAEVLERTILASDQWLGLKPAYLAARELQIGSQSAQLFFDASGLADNDTPFAQAVDRFRELARFLPGTYVEHAGWGVGRVTANDTATLTVDFAGKPAHRIDLAIAQRSLRPIASDSLRALLFRDRETILRERDQSPADLLVRSLREIPGGTDDGAPLAEIKQFLVGTVLAAEEWSAWWKKARAAIEADPRIDDSQAFRQVYRLASADSPANVELPPLDRTKGLAGALTMIRRFLKQHPDLEPQAREAYAAQLARWAATADSADDRMRALPLLCRWLPERRAEWSAAAAQATHHGTSVTVAHSAEDQRTLLDLAAETDTWQPAAFFALASRFRDVRTRALELLAQRLGDQLADAVTALLRAGDQHDTVVLATANLVLRDAFPLAPGHAVSPWDVLAALLRLAATRPSARSDAVHKLLSPQGKLAARLAAAPGPPEALNAVRAALDRLRPGEAATLELTALLQASAHPELARALTTPEQQAPHDNGLLALYDDPRITLMTRETQRREQARIDDMKYQMSVTIPREIAEARALGDLSENAEFDAARQKQGVVNAMLQTALRQMEGVRLIEDLEIPEGEVHVGTEALVRDLADNSERRVWILGDHEGHYGEEVVSYRAPLGRALLGHRPGDTIEVQLPDRTTTMQIISVRHRLPPNNL